MIKDALIKGDLVTDTEGLEFKVIAAAPTEAVLELCASFKAKDDDLFQFYTIDRNDQGQWAFRDDPNVHLVDVD